MSDLGMEKILFYYKCFFLLLLVVFTKSKRLSKGNRSSIIITWEGGAYLPTISDAKDVAFSSGFMELLR